MSGPTDDPSEPSDLTDDLVEQIRYDLAPKELSNGRYRRVEQTRWRGGSAYVYRYRDHTLDRDVAIKGVADRGPAGRRRIGEALKNASIEHPNVRPIYDVIDVPEWRWHYLVLEYLDESRGAILRQYMMPFPWREAADIVLKVLEGLGAIQAKGFVHGDVKPENVWLSYEGDVKLIDFSHAVALGDEPSLAARGGHGGTEGYKAPEQIVRGQLGMQTDVFAVGVLFCELLTGTRPTPDDWNGSDPLRLPEGIPSNLLPIVKRALRLAPDRFASPVDFALAIKRKLRPRWFWALVVTIAAASLFSVTSFWREVRSILEPGPVVQHVSVRVLRTVQPGTVVPLRVSCWQAGSDHIDVSLQPGDTLLGVAVEVDRQNDPDSCAAVRSSDGPDHDKVECVRAGEILVTLPARAGSLLHVSVHRRRSLLFLTLPPAYADEGPTGVNCSVNTQVNEDVEVDP